MTPIDLIDYTHSKKIPSALLCQNPVEVIDIKSSKIIAAYFIDFMTITTISVMSLHYLKSTDGLGLSVKVSVTT